MRSSAVPWRRSSPKKTCCRPPCAGRNASPAQITLPSGQPRPASIDTYSGRPTKHSNLPSMLRRQLFAIRAPMRSCRESSTVTDDHAGNDPVTVEIIDRVAVVTIDRPPVNALASATYREVADAFAVVMESDADIAVLRAKGRHFCAGNDLTESESIAPEDVPAWLDGAKLAFRNIHACPQPVIAAVHGAVY